MDVRESLLAFNEAIGARRNCLRRDECGDWRISGRKGHVYAAPEGFQIFVMGWTAKGWNAAKRDLSFCRLCNDGEDEGAFILNRLPTKSEGEKLRHRLDLPKRREISEDQMADLRERMLVIREKTAKKMALGVAD